MADEFVHMRHPDIPNRSGDGLEIAGPVTMESFERLHQHKGWELVPEEEAQAAVEMEQILDVEAESVTAESIDAIRKRTDLDDLAVRRGIDPTDYENMDSLRDAIKAGL